VPALYALSAIGVLCLIGMALRRWVPFLRSNLVPATVIAGMLGTILMNVGAGRLLPAVTAKLCADITGQLFILSFISIALAHTPHREAAAEPGQTRRGSTGLIRGAWAMGITWAVLYSLQAAVGMGVTGVVGPAAGMDWMYGILIAFAFAQGPGQAATFGALFEEQGWAHATDVALTFSAIGFAIAFCVGVPLARWGLRLGLGRHAVPIGESVRRGYYTRDEQRESLGRSTTFSGSIETLTVHMSLMGVSYILGQLLAWIVGHLPGFLGTNLGGLVFLWAMIAGYIVRWAVIRVGAGHLLSTELQGRITGFTSDFLVVSGFMAVQLAVVMQWMVPIVIVAVVVAVVTLGVTIVIGQRYGSDHDFERTMGMFGTATGTTPTGLALVRIIDPRMKTPTFSEMGLMNLPEMIYLSVFLVISAGFSGAIGPWPTFWCLIGFTLLFAALLPITRSLGGRTWSFRRSVLERLDTRHEQAETQLRGELNTGEISVVSVETTEVKNAEHEKPRGRPRDPKAGQGR